MSAQPPFTDSWRFTGPDVAISCHVTWDEEQECYHATSSAGFHGTGSSDVEAALVCFTAWTTNRRGWFEQRAGDPS